MTTYETSGQESDGTDDVEPRTRRAVTEYISILEDGPGVDGADDLYLAVSHSGESYVLDHRTGACECPDAEYNLSPGEKCKHQRRLEVILGEREIPDAIDPDDADPQLGIHVDVDETPAATDATGDETAVATDGGIVVAGDDAEILDDSPAWDGPFTEYDKYGRPTGHAYVRCPDCGVEVLTGDKDRAYHRPACRYADE